MSADGPSGRRCPFRVLHVVDDFSTANTGVTSTVRQLVQWQAKHCDWVGVYAIGPVDIAPADGVELVSAATHRLTPRWRFPAEGIGGLLAVIAAHRVTHLHIHEFWRGGYVTGMLAARRNRLPVVLSAHGSTAPWALYGQGLAKQVKKQVYWKAFGRFLLSPTAILHAITPLERRHMAAFFGRMPQAVIPNAIDFEASPVPTLSEVTHAHRFVFLGRLHPVKGVDVLIEAFGNCRLADDWQLVIAGPEEIPAYAEQLKEQAAATPRASQISFAGPLYGAAKTELLRSAWAVVLPSRTEVIGMVNLEAASCATPSITTRNTGLEEWDRIGGVLTGDDASALRAALEACAAWTLTERRERGQRINRHVAQSYSLDAVGHQWMQLYESAASGGPRQPA